MTGDLPPIVVAFGPSNYLRFKVEEWFIKKASNITEVEKHSAETISADHISTLLFQDAIFGGSSSYIVRNFEKKSEIHKTLAGLEDSKGIRNKILFMSSAKNISTAQQNLLSKLRAKLVPCYEPNHYELPTFLRALSSRYSLSLEEGAVDLIIDSIGTDLFKLENEIKKLSLVFWDHDTKISQTDVYPYLDCLKEEHAFKLDQLLLEGKFSGAQALLHDLLRRGESHLALLGILSHHCRKSIQIGRLLKEGKPIADIARIIKIPYQILKKYVPYVKKHPPQKFKAALFKCQEADIMFKTSRIDHELVISEVIANLSRT